MRPLEGLILITILFFLLAYLVPKSRRPRWLPYLPALAALFVVIHLVVEGYRWQMVPAYALALIVVAGMIRGVPQRAETQRGMPSRSRRIAALIGTMLGFLVLALAAALPSLSPVFSLPEPTGRYPIGTQYCYWTDEDRSDEYSTDPDDFREVSAQIWYPADLSDDEKPIRYMRKDAARAMTNSQGLQDLPEFCSITIRSFERTHTWVRTWLELVRHSRWSLIRYRD